MRGCYELMKKLTRYPESGTWEERLFLLLSVIHGGKAEFLPETAGKMGQGNKTGFQGDFRYGCIAGFEQVFRVVQSHFSQVLGEGQTGKLPKAGGKIIGGIAGVGGGILNGDGFMEMGMQIAQGTIDKSIRTDRGAQRKFPHDQNK